MLETLIEVVGAPALAAAATLTARRWGPRTGGVISAFPAIVGPVLLITALGHGAAFAARTAEGTLLGLVALSAFVLGYARSAQRRRWPASLTTGWACAAAAALTCGLMAGGAGPPAGLLAAAASLALAYRGLPAGGTGAAALESPPPPLVRDLLTRMALVALLVFSLSTAAATLGPLVGGMLAALPVLASMLAVFTHRQHGGEAATALLRGAVAGMAAFVAFVEVVALLIVPAGIGAAFAGATATALAVQALAVHPIGRSASASAG